MGSVGSCTRQSLQGFGVGMGKEQSLRDTQQRCATLDSVTLSVAMVAIVTGN